MSTNQTRKKILLLDDDRKQHLLIGYLLSESCDDQYELVWHKRYDAGLDYLENHHCDAVLLDHHDKVRSKDVIFRIQLLNKNIPIILMTDDFVAEVEYEAIHDGASDYIIKDQINADVLERTIRYSIDRKKVEQNLDHLAHYDYLTDLPNRMLFLDRLSQATNLASRTNESFTLMFIDLNDFKEINDNYGHEFGDQLLKECAQRFQSAIRKSDTVSRIGGDEFTLLLNNLGDTHKIISLAQKLISLIKQPFYVNNTELLIGCSIGIAVYPEAGTDIETLQRHADIAMYDAKQTGTSCYRFFTHTKNGEPSLERTAPDELEQAIKNKTITLKFNPRIHASSQIITAIEPNVIWRCNHSGEIFDYNQLVRLITNNNTLYAMTRWMILSSLEQLSDIINKGVTLTLGIHYRLLLSSRFLQDFTDILSNHRPPKSSIEVVPLKYNLNDKRRSAEQIIDSLINLNTQISLENFGNDTLSLSMLYKSPIDFVHLSEKISSQWQQDENKPLLEGLVDVAHKLDKKIIAKSINTQEDKNYFSKLGCHYFQGALFGNNLSSEELRNKILIELSQG